MGDYAPSNPTLETSFAVVETTVEIVATFEDRDTPFDTGMPSANSAEPGLFLSLATLLRFLAGFGKHDPFDTSALGLGFIVGGENTAVGAGLRGWFPKALLMGIQTWDPLIPVAGVAVQHIPAGDDAAFDFVYPDFATIFNRLSSFASSDDGGMRLEDGDDLLVRGHFLVLEHSALGLVNDLPCSGKEGFQGVFQALRLWIAVLSQGFQDLLGLGNTLLGDLNQLAIGTPGGFLLTGY